ncbi:putative acetyltransferase [Halovivax ruber XH-70]|uniref:Putative acetyltransferase n=1 Tax=Halovivax ruber (strain DSM 18193 / JCM 13892 / XH-70) TaxID=797302 RepID=L0I587_HALRX|nr:GNAT family N-acetyltransferase [Halovivax ruber]AGB14690.1 putative acetyltransferase [Halovivax ruber XH-70]
MIGVAEPSVPATIRPATPDESLSVRRILDAAMLEFTSLDPRIAADDVLVATDGAGTVRGAIVLKPEPIATGREPDSVPTNPRERGAHVDAIAVRTSHRGRGIGEALVEAAIEREGRLTAHFDGAVRPFYEALGFDIVRMGDDRYAGVRER